MTFVKNILFYSLLIGLVQLTYGQCNIGDACQNPNPDCFDKNYPIIKEFAKAGVIGGIPKILKVSKIIDNQSDFQKEIDKLSESGGGVLLLKNGKYNITETIQLRNKVVLKGQHKDSVIFLSKIRATYSRKKKSTFEFSDVSYSGLENITIKYWVKDFEPIDKSDFKDGGYCKECFKNDPHGLNDLYVRQISINRNSNNCWIQNCTILNSGTDPIFVAGNHNTLRYNYIDRCYNKGAKGNGYYDVRGKYNLIYKETVRRIRHFAIQQKAQYNVVLNCDIQVDVNFHNKDNGYNLVERNNINIPKWHGWNVFSTGGEKYGHQPPGKGNVLFNNSGNYRNKEKRFSEKNTIYTFDGFGNPVRTNLEPPNCNTFYPF